MNQISPSRQPLSTYLHELKATGEGGFEGLISSLLTALVGVRFYVSQSGAQGGRDGKTSLHSGISIAFESKRYTQSTPLNARELIAELQQITASVPELDLWILAASRSVPEQLLTELEAIAGKESVDFLVLDSLTDGKGNLDVLCAAFPELVGQFLPSAEGEWMPILRGIASQQGFGVRIEQLRKLISHPGGGWALWRRAENRDWLTSMHDADEARARFGQPLALRSAPSQAIPRIQVTHEIDAWWSTDSAKTLFVLGEEGDGKSWSVAQWITDQLEQSLDNLPPVIFVPSKDAGSFKSIEDLLTQRVGGKSPVSTKEKRITRWLEASASRANGPLALVVFDGLNERESPKYWRTLLEDAQRPVYAGRVALICTARKTYWSAHFANLPHLAVRTLTVGPFSDAELKEALLLKGKTLDEFPAELQPLLRKPRYLDLAIRHCQSMVESGDITVARLIFEDWRDRQARKETSLSAEGFNELLKGLAQNYREGKSTFVPGEIREMLSSEDDADEVVRELSTGGVLVPNAGRLKVDAVRLPQGLGLLLADRLIETNADGKDLGEEIASWLEPYTGSDIESLILEFGFVYSISAKFPDAVTKELLMSWIGAQNPRAPKGGSIEDTIAAYLPLALGVYIGVAEEIWSKAKDNPWAQEVLLRAIIIWSKRSEAVKTALVPVLEHWLCMIPIEGPPGLRKMAEHSGKPKPKETLSELFGALEPDKPIAIGEFKLTPIMDDMWMRLGHTALSILSQLEDRRPFLRALVLGELVDAVFEQSSHYEDSSWLIRSSRIDLSDQIIEYANTLIDIGSDATKTTAARLLRYIGTSEAWKLRSSIDLDQLFPTPDWIVQARSDPFDHGLGRSTPQQLQDYASRSDLQPWTFVRHASDLVVDPRLVLPSDLEDKLLPMFDSLPTDKIWAGRWRGGEDIHLEDAELVFSRVAPVRIAEFIRAVVQTAPTRSDDALLSLGSKLDEYDLLLDPPSRLTLAKLIEDRSDVKSASTDVTRQIEYQFFAAALWLWNGSEQLSKVRARSEAAFDLRDFAYAFRGPTDGRVMTPSTTTDWFRTLHYLAVIKSPTLTAGQIQCAYEHTDSIVRGGLMQYAHHCSQASKLPPEFVKTWRWTAEQHFFEQTYGSLALIAELAPSGAGDWIDRIDPHHRAWALQASNAADDDWLRYAGWVQHNLEILAGIEPVEGPPRVARSSGDPDTKMPDDVFLETDNSGSIRFVSPESVWGGRFAEWPPKLFPDPDEERKRANENYKLIRSQSKAAESAGNYWAGRSFPSRGLERILSLDFTIGQLWIKLLEDHPKLGGNANSIFVSVLKSLVRRTEWHEEATELYQRLKSANTFTRFVDNETSLEHVDLSIFDAPESPSTVTVWRSRYEACTSDGDLLDLVLLARASETGGSLTWLKKYIDEMSQSSLPVDRAQAIALLGFLAAESSTDCLAGAQGDEEDVFWLEDVRATAATRRKSENTARYWFREFCTREDFASAWSAYRLFQSVADRRCLLWCWRDLVTLNAGDRKNSFFEVNIQVLRRTLKENEKKLRETFLNCKIRDSLAPWMTIR